MYLLNWKYTISSSSYGTKGYFLETPHYNINYVWEVSDDINIISIKASNSSDYGTRPVIEILKEVIDY